MVKTFLIFFLSILTYLVMGQEPAYKKYSAFDQLPEFNYMYLGYTNDTLFLCTDQVNLYSYDGITFKTVKSPDSKYMFREIHYLKNGYFTRNTVNHYWYKSIKSDWKTIPTPKTNIVYNNILYGINSDSIFYFNEEEVKWKYILKISNGIVNANTFHPYIHLNNENEPIFTLRNKKNFSELYDIEQDSFICLKREDDICQGEINKEKIYLNAFNGKLKWNSFKNLYLDSLIPYELKFPIEFRNRFQIDSIGFASNIIEQQNFLHFISIDTFEYAKYSGSLNIPRANFKKIKEDLYFVTSFEGLYKVNPNIVYYSPKNSDINKNIRTFVNHRGSIWMGGYGSGFSKLDSNRFTKINSKFLKENSKNIQNGGFELNDNESWFFNEGGNTIFILKNNTLEPYEIYSDLKKKWFSGYYIDTLNDGRLAFSVKYDNFGILDSIVDHTIYMSTISNKCGLKHGNTWIFDQDKNSRIWLGRFTAGLAVYDIENETVISFPYDLKIKKSFGVLSMYIDDFDQIWLGTTNGLYILPDISEFDIYSENIFDYAIHLDLPDNDVSRVVAIKKAGKYIVIGNKTGISFIEHKKITDFKNLGLIHQLKYGEDINGTKTELNSFYYDKKRFLWVSTLDGVLKIDLWALNIDKTPVDIVFESITNANTTIQIENNSIEIDAVKRNLSLRVAPKYNPSFLNNIYYDFLLENRKGDTILNILKTNNNKLNIDYLSPETYILRVNAYKNGELLDSSNLKIYVPYTFGENPWMWMLIVSLLLLLLTAFLYFRKEKIKQLAKKELNLMKVENEKTQLKVQAIMSSFNPHFINNSLHWVQARYYKDPEMTKMIGKLSENISYIFRQTKSGQAIPDKQSIIYQKK